MNYKGPLWGKVAGKFIKLENDTDYYDSLQAENERLNKVIETIGASKTTVEMAEKINALQSKIDRVTQLCEPLAEHLNFAKAILDLLK